MKDAFYGYRQPAKPISPEITDLTGITDAVVEGQMDERKIEIGEWPRRRRP